jgi:hypothetical protein
MFKISFIQEFKPRAADYVRIHGIRPIFCLLLLFSLYLWGCQTVPTLPIVNLSEPGWSTRQGQVVWRSKMNAPEIAGELLVATHQDGRSFVQFTKTPLPFIIGQSTTNSWQIHFVPSKRTYSGHGFPPTRLSWLYLPRCLSGFPPPKFWHWQEHPDNNGWRLENVRTGEFLEGYLSP